MSDEAIFTPPAGPNPYDPFGFQRWATAVLVQIVAKLDVLLQTQGKQTMTLDDLKAKVDAETTVVGSAIALMTGLNAQLKAALAAGDPAKAQAISDALDAQMGQLAAAVAANTPAPPAP